ncbi:hypothetical protein K438DRAFT_1787434 [Mycena galopus ATCC 62051]|nr:hypothetical protein K438DRAFT_1787434 [Mycena galopus ATCC 62051]
MKFSGETFGKEKDGLMFERNRLSSIFVQEWVKKRQRLKGNVVLSDFVIDGWTESGQFGRRDSSESKSEASPEVNSDKLEVTANFNEIPEWIIARWRTGTAQQFQLNAQPWAWTRRMASINASEGSGEGGSFGEDVFFGFEWGGATGGKWFGLRFLLQELHGEDAVAIKAQSPFWLKVISLDLSSAMPCRIEEPNFSGTEVTTAEGMGDFLKINQKVGRPSKYSRAAIIRRMSRVF